jgi:2-polyprenyl-3-methyl-5-hydroxy-6-metoxy-1,4-benzoquinol methylase
MKKRLNQPEWIDLGPHYYTQKEYQDCLYQLDRIGRFLGGDQASFWAFKQIPGSIKSILDVGCGGGLFTQRLAKNYPQCQATGIDISQTAIQFANEQLDPLLSSRVNFIRPSSPRLDYPPDSFDVVTTTLVCHHLKDEEIIDFLQKACSVASKGVIINDLHRHFLATASFSCMAPLFFRNRLIIHDGLISIRKAFKKSDWISYLKTACIPPQAYSITWHPFFRWIIIIYPDRVKA